MNFSSHLPPPTLIGPQMRCSASCSLLRTPHLIINPEEQHQCWGTEPSVEQGIMGSRGAKEWARWEWCRLEMGEQRVHCWKGLTVRGPVNQNGAWENWKGLAGWSEKRPFAKIYALVFPHYSRPGNSYFPTHLGWVIMVSGKNKGMLISFCLLPRKTGDCTGWQDIVPSKGLCLLTRLYYNHTLLSKTAPSGEKK
jgi:hypothetical protein